MQTAPPFLFSCLQFSCLRIGPFSFLPSPRLRYAACTVIAQFSRKLRGNFQRRRSADIPVRSNVPRRHRARTVDRRPTFVRCCGQECPRSGSVAALLLCTALCEVTSPIDPPREGDNIVPW